MSVYLITGANRGIGQEVCRQLVAKGHAAIAGARTPGKVKHGEPLALGLGGKLFVAMSARSS